MANFPDITVKISDEDREMLARFCVNIAWLREHLEELQTFAQIPAISISSPSDNTAPIDRSCSWISYKTNDLPPNTTYKVRIGGKDYSTICLDCGKPLSECKCADPRTGIGAVVDQPGD